MTPSVFDAPLHIIDPAHPLVENNGFMPEPFTVEDYRGRIDGLGVEGGAVVSGFFQAFDQGYLIDALRALGPNYVGVTQITEDTSNARILELHEAGLPQRLRLVEQGVKVKATGLGRVELDPVATTRATVNSLAPEQVSAVFWDIVAAFYLGR